MKKPRMLGAYLKHMKEKTTRIKTELKWKDVKTSEMHTRQKAIRVFNKRY